MASYEQFSQEERIMLSALKKRGLNQEEIGRELGKNQSSISREIKRNGNEDGSYHAGEARRKKSERKKKASQKLKRIENDVWLEKYIVKKLKQYWSPEQIAGRWKKDYGETICHETIYQYVYAERSELKRYLRCRKGKYRRRYGTRKREKQRESEKKRRIDTRPEIVERRERLGDWEGDTVVGERGTGYLITHVERKSGYVMVDYVVRATADAVNEKTKNRFKKIPKKKRKTMTYDNGKEFEWYEKLEKEIEMKVYFAYPYHAWERGTNENTNGLIRQFFPKKTSFSEVTEKNTRRAERLLNSRPRKRLGYLTPLELFVKNMHLP